MGFQVVIDGEEKVFVSIEEMKRLVLTIERKEATSEETGVDDTRVEIETKSG